MIVKATIATLTAILVAFFYSNYSSISDNEKEILEQNIINAWKNHIKSPTKKFKRLYAGINSNVDLIVSGIALLKALNVNPGKSDNVATLSSLDDLQATFSHFFSKGSAAERAFLDEQVFKHIVTTAQSLPDAQFYIGGNAALMATKVSEDFPDVQITFIGPVGPKLVNLLPNNLSIPNVSHIAADEVHLIMEYRVGDEWGGHRATVASRFITSYDESNAKATMLEAYFSSLKVDETDLALISGLHMIEGQTEEIFTNRLKVMGEGLKRLPFSLPVHLELASMANEKFVLEVLQKTVPLISSLGLNEQELLFSSLVAGGPHSEDFHRHIGQPQVHKISDMVLWLLKNFGNSREHPDYKLTRVHFHSLTFHIIGTKKNTWKNSDIAVAAGTRKAGKQACDVNSLDASLVDLKIPLNFSLFSGDRSRNFDPKNPVIIWEKDGYEFVLSPVLVCKEPQKTVGLGDSISATGLMYSEYHFSS